MSLAGRVAARALRPLGLTLAPGAQTRRDSTLTALRRARSIGVDVRTVVDIGAAFGDWAAECRGIYPNARLVLVEPLEEFAPFLESRVAELGDATWVAAAAGRESGFAELHVHDDLVGSSTRVEPGLRAASRRVPAVSVDDLVAEHDLEPPFLLKADVQGGELDVVAGARRTLASTELVVLETLFFEFYEGGAVFGDVVVEMREEGLAVYDLCDLSYRPLDGALAQADVLFVPRESVLRRDTRYADGEQRARRDEALRGLYRRRCDELDERRG